MLCFYCFSYANTNDNLSISVDGFIENKGQIIDQNGNVNQDVLFLLSLENFNVLIRKNGFSYEFKKVIDSSIIKSQHQLDKFQKKIDYAYDYKIQRIDFNFLSSNNNIEVFKKNKQKATLNYYTYGTPEKGVVGVNCFEKIRLNNIYDGVDIEFIYQVNNKSFKYNIYADSDELLNKIKFKINGAVNRLDNDGNIEIETILGAITEVIPYSEGINLENDTNRLDVSFVNQKKNIYGVKLNQKFEGKIIIDPVPTLVWATYYGGSEYEWGYSLVKDSLDFFYMGGFTRSPNNIATSGAHQTTLASSFLEDGFIAKFDSTSQLIWGTYMGGNQGEFIWDIARIDNNNIVITGQTNSPTNIATGGSYQTTLQGNGDAFLSKFTNNGILVWSTYYGGEGQHDIGRTLICNDLNDIYIGGSTNSTTLISTIGTYQTTLQALKDGFIAKFDANGNFLVGTYYGGSADDQIKNLTINSNNEVIFSALTFGSNGLALNALHQNSYAGGSTDGMYGMFDSSLNLLWANYFGGPNDDNVNASTVDNNDTIYITGYTSSVTGIATVGSNQTIYGGGFSDGFVAKVNPNGSIAWSSYIGGTGYDELWQIKFHPNGSLYFCGFSYSQSGFATANAWQPNPYNFPNSHDAALVKYSTNDSLIWATYYGGEADDEFYDLEFGSNGDIYLTGQVLSDTNISTPGAYQDTLGNASWDDPDGWLVRFTEGSCSSLSLSITSNSPLCENDTLILSIDTGYTYSWNGPNGYTNTTNSDTLYQVTDLEEGVYSCAISDTSACSYIFQNNVVIYAVYSDTLYENICVGDSFVFNGTSLTIPGLYNSNLTSINSCDSIVYLNLSVIPLPTVNAGNDTIICFGDTVQLQSFGASIYNWFPSISLSDTSIANPLALPSLITSYIVTGTDTNNCSNSDTVVVNVNSLPTISASSDTTVCSGVSVQLNATGGNSYTWSPTIFLNDSTIPSPLASPISTTTYFVISVDTNGCSNSDSLTITINPTPIINIGNDTTICQGESIVLYSTPGTSNVWSDGSITDSIVVSTTGIYWVQSSNGQCMESDSINVTTVTVPVVDLGVDTTICQGESIVLYSTPSTSNVWSDGSITNSITVSTTGMYWVQSSNAQCTETDSINILVNTYPVVNLGNDTTICQGQSVVLNTGLAASYLWSDGSTTNSITLSATGMYWVQSSNGLCTETDSINITIVAGPIVNLGNDTSICQGQSLTLYSNPSITNLWSDGSITDSITVSTTGMYWVQSSNGLCTEADSINVVNTGEELVTIPNVFTPNGDGSNDQFVFHFYFDSTLILNRWGQEMFKSNSNGIYWDGKTTSGKDVPDGTYFYIINGRDNCDENKIFKGSVTLLR